MIILELKIIGINILYGVFSLTIINALSLLLDKYGRPLFSNFFYFLVTISLGLLYIIYIDSIFLNFKLYYLFFILLGFILASNFKLLSINDNFGLFIYLNKLLFKFLKHILCFMINYSLFKALFDKIKHFTNKKR
jgi:hypothetical protein